MSPDEFTATCKRLFGRGPEGYGWKAEMHRRFGTSPRTIQAWASGDNPIPGIVSGLLLMLDQRTS